MTTTDKLAEALRDAAQSLETIAKNAGKRLDSEGQENMLAHHDQVRGYAASRAGVARAALATTPAADEPVGYVAAEIYAAWRKVGADVAGLKWDDFVEALRKGKESSNG